MIKKRYKNTPALQQAIALKAELETLPVILAEIDLPKIEDEFPNHRQVLRVQDINVVVSCDYTKISPKRILIHETTGKEIDRNLYVPLWEIEKDSVSSQVDENGQRVYHEMEWFDDETDEVVTTQTVISYDSEGEEISEEQPLEPLEDEVFLMPSIPYLMKFTKQVVLPDLIEMFSAQFVSDNWDVWSHVEKPE